MAEDCSRRRFNFPEDVLPALSGLARCTVSLDPERCVAGMWEFGIALQLGWYVTSARKKIGVSRPSFSLISAPGPIEHAAYLSTATRPVALCELVDVNVVHATADAFGALSYASLRL